MLVLEGTLDSIVFRNPGNSYTVAKVLTEDGIITVVGYFPFLPIGSEMKMSGEMVFHDKFGEQFKIKRMITEKIDYSNSMEAYLRSGAIDKVGPKMTDRIIAKFGDDTYDIFKNSPERLLEVEGIGKKTLEKIIDSFNDQIDMKEALIELANFGITNNLANKLLSKYGDNVVDIIKENPYLLIDSTDGVGFKTADQIAKESGIQNNDVNRIEAGLVYLLNLATRDGHSFLYLDELLNKGFDYLQINIEDYKNAEKKFLLNKNIRVLREENNSYKVYPKSIINAENYISMKINKLLKTPVRFSDFDILPRISMMESLEEIKFGEKQVEAIKNAFSNRVLIITGGPGTGKTTTLKSILNIADELGFNYALAAPTGRAAKRMEQATGRDAKTIHRLLEYQFNGSFMEFNKNQKDPLDNDMIIIDEMSMVDTSLLYDLMNALKDDVRIVFLGDVNQIPSVGSGNVLKDLIESNIIPIIKLDKIFRQTGGSMIIDNAHKINEGIYPIMNTKGTDFFMIASEKEVNTVEIIKELIKTRLPKFTGISSINDIQIMTPMKKGIGGVENLNVEIQNTINPPDNKKDEIKYRDMIFRLGDKVMQTKNNYQVEWKAYTIDRIEYDNGLGIYNGDIGFIKEVDTYNNTLTVDYEGKEVEYTEDSFNEITLAYAITIHKSQGSEFPVVVIPIHYAPEILANRNLIYTAITRASKFVVLVGKDTRLLSMIKNTYVNERNTGLKEKIIKHNRIIRDYDQTKLFNMR